MADKDPKSPATTSLAYDAMVGRWALLEALLGGTETMRAARETYLPKHEEETDLNYEVRLASTTLLNITDQTLESLSSKPFCEPIQLEDVPEQIEDLLQNIDLQGNNLDVFARQWFRGGVAKAFHHVLVDFPKVEAKLAEDGTPRPRTLADDAAEGVRPYWVSIHASRVIFASAEVIAGREVLRQIRILEPYTETVGFAEVERKRIRILEPGKVQIWTPKKQRPGMKEAWEKVDEWETGLDVIPLVTFYSVRDGFMYGKPALLDLAYMNTAHWQSTSSQRNVLRVTRFPMLACSGGDPDDDNPITVGPSKVLHTPEAQGKYYYVEHNGAAIEAGRLDLEDLERQMSGYGAEFLKDEPGDTTATEKAIDSAESNSSLSAMALRFQDAVTQALDFTALWLKIAGGKGGKVEVVRDYSPSEDDTPGLDALDKARTRRDISREAYLDGLIRRNILPEDFDMEEDLALITDEATNLAGAAGLDLNPGMDPPDLPPKLGPDGKPVGKPGLKKPPKKVAKGVSKS